MKFYFYTIITAIFLVFLAPSVALGQTDCVGDCVSQGLGKIQREAYPNQSGAILGSNSVVGAIGVVIKLILFVSGALAVLFVVIGGFLYLTSAGNDEQATKGKTTITNALIGIVIIILSYVIVNVVVNLVNCGFTGAGSVFGSCGGF